MEYPVFIKPDPDGPPTVQHAEPELPIQHLPSASASSNHDQTQQVSEPMDTDSEPAMSTSESPIIQAVPEAESNATLGLPATNAEPGRLPTSNYSYRIPTGNSIENSEPSISRSENSLNSEDHSLFFDGVPSILTVPSTTNSSASSTLALGSFAQSFQSQARIKGLAWNDEPDKGQDLDAKLKLEQDIHAVATKMASCELDRQSIATIKSSISEPIEMTKYDRCIRQITNKLLVPCKSKVVVTDYIGTNGAESSDFVLSIFPRELLVTNKISNQSRIYTDLRYASSKVEKIPVNFDEFKICIYRWDPTDFMDGKKCRSLFHNIEKFLRENPLSFKDFDQYLSTFIPLIMLQIHHAIDSSKVLRSQPLSTAMIDYRTGFIFDVELDPRTKVESFYFNVPIDPTRDDEFGPSNISFGDIIVFFLCGDGEGGDLTSNETVQYFGFVAAKLSDYFNEDNKDILSTTPFRSFPGASDSTTLQIDTFEVLALTHEPSLQESQGNTLIMKAKRVCSIRHLFVQARGLYLLRDSFPVIAEELTQPKFLFTACGQKIESERRIDVRGDGRSYRAKYIARWESGSQYAKFYSKAQLEAIQKIVDLVFGADNRQSSLLHIHGVQNSGKTEIILEALKEIVRVKRLIEDDNGPESFPISPIVLCVRDDLTAREMIDAIEEHDQEAERGHEVLLKKIGPVFHIPLSGKLEDSFSPDKILLPTIVVDYCDEEIIKLKEQMRGLSKSTDGELDGIQQQMDYYERLKTSLDEGLFDNQGDPISLQGIIKGAVSHYMLNAKLIIGHVDAISRDETFCLNVAGEEPKLKLPLIVVDDVHELSEPQALCLAQFGARRMVFLGRQARPAYLSAISSVMNSTALDMTLLGRMHRLFNNLLPPNSRSMSQSPLVTLPSDHVTQKESERNQELNRYHDNLRGRIASGRANRARHAAPSHRPPNWPQDACWPPRSNDIRRHNFGAFDSANASFDTRGTSTRSRGHRGSNAGRRGGAAGGDRRKHDNSFNRYPGH